jgi:hypothetical protein
VLHRIGVAVLRASLWSALAGALITLVLWLRTSPEFRLGFQPATWFGLSCALALVPSLAMELGVVHLLLDRGSADPDKRHSTTKS